jgi:hypothetical protein
MSGSDNSLEKTQLRGINYYVINVIYLNTYTASSGHLPTNMTPNQKKINILKILKSWTKHFDEGDY